MSKISGLALIEHVSNPHSNYPNFSLYGLHNCRHGLTIEISKICKIQSSIILRKSFKWIVLASCCVLLLLFRRVILFIGGDSPGQSLVKQTIVNNLPTGALGTEQSWNPFFASAFGIRALDFSLNQFGLPQTNTLLALLTSFFLSTHLSLPHTG
jgi:hypothetical protein